MSADEPPETFGERLRRLRRAVHGPPLTQLRLARRSGLGRETVYRLERGSRTPYADTVARLAAALGVRPDELDPEWNGFMVADDQAGDDRGPGERLREVRRSRGVRLARAAAAAGVGIATLSRFERGLGGMTDTLMALTTRYSLNPRGLKFANPGLARELGFRSSDELSEACGLPVWTDPWAVVPSDGWTEGSRAADTGTSG